MSPHAVLIVDDDPLIGFAMADFFGARGDQVEVATTCAAARAAVTAQVFDVAVVDHRLPDGDGVALIAALRELAPQLGILVVTGAGSIDLAVRAMREGAQNFITKPIELPALATMLDRIADERRVARLAASMRRSRTAAAEELPAAVRELAARTAAASLPVLLLGETGTGKGVLARWLHDHGAARDEAMVELNSAGLSRELVESELFGHERGAFTGATTAKAGLFELAHRGTLFLDEVAELDLVVQAKLLKVLEDHRMRRVGGTVDRQIETRIIAATSRDLDAMMEQGAFRRDLYYRLAGVVIEVPPLRARNDELPMLVHRLAAAVDGPPGRPFTSAALSALAQHDWPGNVRELRNVVERACMFSSGDPIDVAEVALHLRPRRGATATGTQPLPRTFEQRPLAEVEREHIERTLAAAAGKVDVAAEWLGLPRSTLYERLRRYGLARRG